MPEEPYFGYYSPENTKALAERDALVRRLKAEGVSYLGIVRAVRESGLVWNAGGNRMRRALSVGGIQYILARTPKSQPQE